MNLIRNLGYMLHGEFWVVIVIIVVAVCLCCGMTEVVALFN